MNTTKDAWFYTWERQNHFLLESIQTGTEVNPTSYPRGSRDFFLGSKVAGM